MWLARCSEAITTWAPRFSRWATPKTWYAASACAVAAATEGDDGGYSCCRVAAVALVYEDWRRVHASSGGPCARRYVELARACAHRDPGCFYVVAREGTETRHFSDIVCCMSDRTMLRGRALIPALL